MRIFFPNGDTRTGPFSESMCTSYVADRIEFDHHDIEVMRRMACGRPKTFQSTMLQLAHRFPANRIGRLPDKSGV